MGETGVARAGVGETGVARAGVGETGVARAGVGETGVARAGVGETGVAQASAGETGAGGAGDRGHGVVARWSGVPIGFTERGHGIRQTRRSTATTRPITVASSPGMGSNAGLAGISHTWPSRCR
ncbi:hypothetical protein GCM10010166_28770 [Couchioplanes caeruleus subsp. azureus]|nr:hypothetical protein GCM10010166_28770 [Couchioplanes caeruleus subsp. azureus]